MKTSEMNIQEVLKHLPHRYPFVLVDRVLEVESGKRIVAIKNVTFNEHFFAGHFPENPIMPGVLILEALAQAGVILAFCTTNTLPSEKEIYFFAGVENARFKRVVEPGDQLRLEVEFLWEKRGIWKLKGTALVGNEVACVADLLSAKKEENKHDR